MVAPDWLGFGRTDKGNPTAEIEPIPKGRKKNKVIQLFRFWHADLEKRAHSCPLRSEAYGGLPSSGGYASYTELEIGAARYAEAAHCVLGSLGKILAGERRDPERWREAIRYERAHLREEMGIMENVLQEYSRDIYTDLVNNPREESRARYAEESINHIRKVSPKLQARVKAKMAAFQAQRDLPDLVADVAFYTYSAVDALAGAMMKATQSRPITNPFKDNSLRARTIKVRRAVGALDRVGGS